MIIQTPEPTPRLIEEYDIRFVNGDIMSVAVDKTAGDTIDFDASPLAVQIRLVAKSSPTNPEVVMRAEDHTVFVSHILSITKKTKQVIPLTTEQQLEWQKVIQQMSKTIQ
jgi:hypothetical protein